MKHRTRVLVVDDSAFSRGVLSRKLDGDPEIEVIGLARDGAEALEKTRDLKPDVVTLDMQMPLMDGLTALRHIMADCPTPVVVVSALTSEDAKLTLEALELGAVDFFLKPSPSNPVGTNGGSEDLATKVKQASRVSAAQLKTMAYRSSRSQPGSRERRGRPEVGGKVAVIGSSTGGPRALCQLFRDFPDDIPSAMLVVQHMPPGFTRSLADRLDQLSRLEVTEAQPGDVLRQGRVLVAPGGFHMRVDERGRIELTREALVNGVRPAVDVTMESVARLFGADSLGVVLTGIGSDGVRGAASIRAAGGRVLVEDESTCTVFGMPKAVIESGNADVVVPLSRMAEEIIRTCKASRNCSVGDRL
ncbi:MAG: response regulator receiver modulated CheB methylesterase [Dehalococcoidia bacterium]|nr:response regulator receiver modulated CheB methylesterase [Dehalococcoidia bacterium]